MVMLWKNELQTGLVQVDHQNKEVISILEKYFELCENDDNNKEIFSIVKDIDRMMCQYMQEEEVIQVVFKYNNYERHKQSHNKLKQMVETLQKLLVRFPPTSQVIQIANESFYKALCSHIMVEDKKLSMYVEIRNGMMARQNTA